MDWNAFWQHLKDFDADWHLFTVLFVVVGAIVLLLIWGAIAKRRV